MAPLSSLRLYPFHSSLSDSWIADDGFLHGTHGFHVPHGMMSLWPESGFPQDQLTQTRVCLSVIHPQVLSSAPRVPEWSPHCILTWPVLQVTQQTEAWGTDLHPSHLPANEWHHWTLFWKERFEVVLKTDGKIQMLECETFCTNTKMLMPFYYDSVTGQWVTTCLWLSVRISALCFVNIMVAKRQLERKVWRKEMRGVQFSLDFPKFTSNFAFILSLLTKTFKKTSHFIYAFHNCYLLLSLIIKY